MLLSLAQVKFIHEFSKDKGVDIERGPYDEYVSVRRYGADIHVRVYRDGRVVLGTRPSKGKPCPS